MWRMSGIKVAVFLTVVIPFGATVFALWSVWGWGVGWRELVLLVGFYLASGFGVTVGFHRLFTHQSFVARRPLAWALAALGSMAVEGPVLKWVRDHLTHHRHSDEAGDPHSPHAYGVGAWAVLRGFWHAHTGWLFGGDEPVGVESAQLVRLKQDRGLVVIDRLFVFWVALGLLLPALIGGLWAGSWLGFGLGLLWGGLVRIFILHHVTWSINSVCHLWGTRPFRSQDQSRNNPLFGVLGMGEGWHNNHHAFPSSARHGLRWWQLDGSYLVILILKWLRLASEIKLPSANALGQKLARPV